MPYTAAVRHDGESFEEARYIKGKKEAAYGVREEEGGRGAEVFGGHAASAKDWHGGCFLFLFSRDNIHVGFIWVPVGEMQIGFVRFSESAPPP